jgi:1,4-dihydroxy-2-naphthoate octaprenyltransferase
MKATNVQAILRGMRLPFLTGSVLPVWAAAAFLSREQRVDPRDLGLTTLAVAALHLASNLANDAADSDNSDRVNRFGTPFSGGSRVLLDGTLSRRSLWLLVAGLVGISVAAAAVLALQGRPLVWVLGAAGGLIGLCYSTASARLMSRGLGELAVYVSFGPLLTLGSGYALSGTLDPRQLALGAVPGFLIAAVLWINQFPDREADAAVGKRNLVVRLGIEPARAVYVGLMFAPFLGAAVLAATQLLPSASLILLLVSPLTVKAVRLLLRAPADPRAVLPVQALTIASHAAVSLLLTAGLWFSGRAS